MLTEEQRIARKAGIGGSDVAAILGVSKFRTAVDVYFDKIGESQETPATAPMQWGNILEPIILKHYESLTGVSADYSFSKVSTQYPWMRANVDALRRDGIIVEAKMARSGEEWGEPGTHEIPQDYLCQVAHYRIVLDAPKVDIAVLIGGSDFRIYTYEKKQAFERMIIDRERAFWHDNVLAKVAPDPFNSEDLELLFPDSNGKTVIANERIKELLSSIKANKAQSKLLKQQEEELQFSVKKFMGDNEILTDEFGKMLVTWKTQNHTSASLVDLRTKYPEIYDALSTESKRRVFLPKKGIE